MENLDALIEILVPDVVARGLTSICAATGMSTGATPGTKFWFRPPKVHIFMSVFIFAVCVALQRGSRQFRGQSLTELATRGVGWSTRCPINTLLLVILAACFGSQVYLKSVRPQPLVQLGWLFMPCHLITLAWMYVFARNKAKHYASDCFVASLLVDYWWQPFFAAVQPDWGDHQFKIEGVIFTLHHGLLLALPVYYAARYHTLALSQAHVCYLTWTLAALNYFFYTPYAMLTGLNLNYMLYPPTVSVPLPALRGPYYKEFCVPIFITVSIMSNCLVRGVAKVCEKITKTLCRTKRKLS